MPINHYREAMLEGINVVAVGAIVGGSLAFQQPLLAIAGAVVEVAYLLFVPDTVWYGEWLGKRIDAQTADALLQLQNRILPALSSDMQERFHRLEDLRMQIEAQRTEKPPWFADVLRRLDYLMEQFLIFNFKRDQFREFLRSVLSELHAAKLSTNRREGSDTTLSSRVIPREVPTGKKTASSLQHNVPSDPTIEWVSDLVAETRAYYERERNDLAVAQRLEQNENTRTLMEQRDDMLQRRQSLVDEIGTILVKLIHQLRLMEEVFGRINAEIHDCSPEQIQGDIEEVVLQTEKMAQALTAMTPYEELIAI